MDLKIEVRSAQLDELLNVANNIDQRSADTASDVALCVRALVAFGEKFDALALKLTAVSAPAQTVLPPADKPVTDKPTPAQSKRKPRGRRKAGIVVISSEVIHAEPLKSGNGEAHADQEVADIEDEDALRARVAFESKRVQRTFGVGASRAIVKKVAGGDILNVDDVPSWQLLTLLDELRAM